MAKREFATVSRFVNTHPDRSFACCVGGGLSLFVRSCVLCVCTATASLRLARHSLTHHKSRPLTAPLKAQDKLLPNKRVRFDKSHPKNHTSTLPQASTAVIQDNTFFLTFCGSYIPPILELEAASSASCHCRAMLFASREALVSDTRVQMLAIRARELDWLMSNSRLIANLSSLIAGYGYTALIYTKYLDDPSLCDRNDPLCAEMTYPLCVTITMGFSLLSLFGAMLITLLAPALALRGPEGSLNLCVDMVLQEYTYTLLVFGAALLMLLVSTIVWSMTRANQDARMVLAASIITLATLAAAVLIISTSMRAVRRFDIPAGSRLVTGRFTGMDPEREEERLRLAALNAIAKHGTPSQQISSPTSTAGAAESVAGGASSATLQARFGRSGAADLL